MTPRQVVEGRMGARPDLRASNCNALHCYALQMEKADGGASREDEDDAAAAARTAGCASCVSSLPTRARGRCDDGWRSRSPASTWIASATRIGRRIGRLGNQDMARLGIALAFVLGLAD